MDMIGSHTEIGQARHTRPIVSPCVPHRRYACIENFANYTAPDWPVNVAEHDISGSHFDAAPAEAMYAPAVRRSTGARYTNAAASHRNCSFPACSPLTPGRGGA